MNYAWVHVRIMYLQNISIGEIIIKSCEYLIEFSFPKMLPIFLKLTKLHLITLQD